MDTIFPQNTTSTMRAQTLIQTMVRGWYGMTMPCRVLTKEQEIAEFENDHPEVPPALWELVNHDVRLWRMWMKEAVDLVVRKDGELKFVQDICFIDSYENVSIWHRAVFDLMKQAEELWVVVHEGNA